MPESYCSLIDSGSLDTCTAREGSPVICGQSYAIAGIVISTGTCTGPIGSRILNFHSVGDFEEWIRESIAGKVGKTSISIVLMLIMTSAKQIFS